MSAITYEECGRKSPFGFFKLIIIFAAIVLLAAIGLEISHGAERHSDVYDDVVKCTENPLQVFRQGEKYYCVGKLEKGHGIRVILDKLEEGFKEITSFKNKHNDVSKVGNYLTQGGKNDVSLRWDLNSGFSEDVTAEEMSKILQLLGR